MSVRKLDLSKISSTVVNSPVQHKKLEIKQTRHENLPIVQQRKLVFKPKVKPVIEPPKTKQQLFRECVEKYVESKKPKPFVPVKIEYVNSPNASTLLSQA